MANMALVTWGLLLVLLLSFSKCNGQTATPAPCSSTCHADATCTGGSCVCNGGFTGDGTTCQDDTDPVIDDNTCQPPASQVADPRSTTTSVTFATPTATDSTGVTPTVSCVPASGSPFTIGDTPVTCTAQDAAGNEDTCTFMVTVTDFDECSAVDSNKHDCDGNAVCANTPGSYTCTCNPGYTGSGQSCADNPPVFTNTPCQSPITQQALEGSPSATVTWTNPQATDTPNPTPTVTCLPASPATFQIGDHTVTCTATDSGGETATCMFAVTVTDFDECANPDACHANAACTNMDGGFTCNCNDGYDGDGNTCTDITPPVIDDSTCQSPPSQIADPRSTTASVTFATPTATDTTGVTPTVSCAPASGSPFTIGDTTVTCTAQDEAGNEDTCTFMVTVTDFDECTANQDDCHANAACTNTDGNFTCECNDGYDGDGKTCIDITPPVIVASTCQSLPSQVADPRSMTASVTFTTPTATDSTGATPTVSCSPASGSPFTIGDTTVTCTARDEAGNEDTCTFTVTVTDFDECSAPDPNQDDCHVNATCTNTDGSYICACNAGYFGSGQSCNECPAGMYGLNCASVCTCVTAATCNKVNGDCTCDPIPNFPNAVCDKDEFDVQLSAIGPVLDTSEDVVDNATLRCAVNLPHIDLELPVTIIKLPNGTPMNAERTMNGSYDVILTDITTADSGTYRCNATTIIAGVYVPKQDDLVVDVRSPGRIISLTPKVTGELGETVSLECMVFADPTPTVTWYNQSSMEIFDNDPKYSIAISTDGQQLTSTLNVMNLQRTDNGNYTCKTSNNLTPVQDAMEAAVIVLEKTEVDNVAATPLSAQTIKITWQIPYAGNLPFTCTVEYQMEGTSTWIITPSPPELAVSHNVTNLEAFTLYLVRVTCGNTVGSNAALLPAAVRTLQAAPDAPENVGVSSVTSSTLTVVWEKPTVKRGTIAFYRVTTTDSVTNDEKTQQTPGPGNPAPLSLEVPELIPFRDYTIYVTAFNVQGSVDLMGDDSDSIVRKTGEAAPTPPVNVQSDDQTDTCEISWDPPETKNGVIRNYTVHYSAYPRPMGDDTPVDQANSGYYGIRDGDQMTFTFNKSKQAQYSEYQFRITAATILSGNPSDVGNGSCTTQPAAPAEGSVQQPVAGEPVSPDKEAITSTTFYMALEPVDGRNGPISCYDIIVKELLENEEISGMDPDRDFPQDQVGTYGDTSRQAYTAFVKSGSDMSSTMNVKIGSERGTRCGGIGSRRKRQAAYDHTGVNGRLKPNTRYTAFVRAFVKVGDGLEEVYTSSPFMEPVTTNAGLNVVGIVIGVILAVLIVVVLVLGALIYMKRRKQMPLLHEGENGVAMVPVTEKEPEVTHMVVLPITLENLSETVRQKSENDDEIFKAEFKSIPEATGDVTRDATNLECNREKNRYINIGAYDHTRVRLSPIEGEEGSDYINACFVDGYEKPRKFIAAQGAREDTVLDFWRMVWEQNCATIIMLTKCLENGREKCAEYWPEEDAIMYDDIIVTLDDVVTCADYVIRKFTLQKHIETDEDEDEDAEPIIGESRTLMQFHFLGWPDFGIPKYPHSMLCFVKRIRHMTGSRIEPGNIIVHCSAGVGRTGTYILIDSMLDMMKKEKKVDIYNVIYKLRNQRNLLVQSLVQYIFIHKALMEEFLYGHTEVDVGSFHIYNQKLCSKKSDADDAGVDTEYRTVASLPVDNTDQKTGNIEANKHKNRIRQVIPYDRNRVKLERLTGQEHSNYINASFIDGYEHKKAYIAAQGPLPNTMGDFWRMAWENQCSTIVMLTDCEERGQNVCTKYWPESGETLNPAFLVVSVKDCKEEEDCTIRDLEVSTTKGAGTKLIRQYHYHGWPEVGVPDNSASLVKVIGLAHEYQQDIGRFPILVHCSAGSGRTGVFITLSYLLQRAKAEGIVDVFQAVRTLRQQRPHMVQDVAQYQFCYRAMMEYLDSFDHYANFK